MPVDLLAPPQPQKKQPRDLLAGQAFSSPQQTDRQSIYRANVEAMSKLMFKPNSEGEVPEERKTTEQLVAEYREQHPGEAVMFATPDPGFWESFKNEWKRGVGGLVAPFGNVGAEYATEAGFTAEGVGVGGFLGRAAAAGARFAPAIFGGAPGLAVTTSQAMGESAGASQRRGESPTTSIARGATSGAATFAGGKLLAGPAETFIKNVAINFGGGAAITAGDAIVNKAIDVASGQKDIKQAAAELQSELPVQLTEGAATQLILHTTTIAAKRIIEGKKPNEMTAEEQDINREALRALQPNREPGRNPDDNAIRAPSALDAAAELRGIRASQDEQPETSAPPAGPPTAAERPPAQPDGAVPDAAMGAASAAEFPEFPMGTTKASRAEQMDRFALDQAMQAIKETNQSAWESADGRIAANPQAGRHLVDELIGKPRAVNPIERAVLIKHWRSMHDAHKNAQEELGQAFAADDAAEIQRLVQAEKLIADERVALNEVIEAAGAESGRSLQAIKMMMAQDYSLEAMVRNTEAAKGGLLTPEERGTVESLFSKIDESRKKSESVAEAESQKAVEADIEQTIAKAKKPATPTTPEQATERAAKITEAVKESDGTPAEVGRYARMLAEDAVEGGADTVAKVVRAVHGELVKVLPDITPRQVMDAISGYGDFKPLNKDPVKAQLRDIKGQSQQIAKLHDIREGQAPLKTGVERREPSDKERRLVQRVNEEKKKAGIVTTDPAKQLKSSLDAAKKRIDNQIADLNHEILTREKIVRQRTDLQPDAELQAKIKVRDELRKQRDAIFGKNELTDGQRLEMAMKAAERSLAAAEARLADAKQGKFTTGKRPSKTPKTEELGAIRARRDAVAAEVAELKALADPKKTPEEISDARLQTWYANRTADLQKRLARGDFETTKKPEPKRSKETIAARGEYIQAKGEFQKALGEFRRARRSMTQKVFEAVPEGINTARSIVTSLDYSAVLRQGGLVAAAHPVMASKALPTMFRAGWSEKGAAKSRAEIESRENFESGLYKRSKLELTEIGDKLSKMEEAFMSHWSKKLYGVAGSECAYVAFLNQLRADLFDSMYKSMSKRGTVSDADAKLIANYVNIATGRGDLGILAPAATALNTAFFSARNVVSRFQYLTGQPLRKGLRRGEGSLAVRKQIAKEYARTILGIGTVIGAAAAAGAKVMLDDPTDSKFGKIQFGDTLIDPWAGLQQVSVFLAREGNQLDKTLKGEKREFTEATGAKELGRFLRTKLSPMFGSAVDLTTGENVVGEKVTLGSAALNAILPLSLRDIYQGMREEGVPKGAALGLLQIFGMGVQTRKKKPPKLKKTAPTLR